MSPERITHIRLSASLPRNFPSRLGALSYKPPDNHWSDRGGIAVKRSVCAVSCATVACTD
jgi:hypothetical protein